MKLLTKKKLIVLFCILIAIIVLIIIFFDLDLFAKYDTYIYKHDNELFEIAIPKKFINNSIFQKRKYVNEDKIIIFTDSIYFNYLNYKNEYWQSIGIIKMYFHYYPTYSEYFTSGLETSYDEKNNNFAGKNKLKNSFVALKALRFKQIEFRFQYISDKNIEILCDIEKNVKFVESIKVKKIK